MLKRTANLTYSWSCSVISLENYGSFCNYIFGMGTTIAPLNRSTIVIAENTMNTSVLYQISVICSAADGRSSSAAVVITPTLPGAASVRFQSTLTKFNADSVLKLVATAAASTGQQGNLSTIITYISKPCYFV